MGAVSGRWFRNIVVRRFAILGLFSALVLGVAAVALKATGFADAFSVVARAADLHGPLRRIADLGLVQESERLTDIPVVPAVESQHLADDLRGHARVRILLTDLVSHAEADRPARPLDVLKLIVFWRDVLAQTTARDAAAAARYLQPVLR